MTNPKALTSKPAQSTRPSEGISKSAQSTRPSEDIPPTEPNDHVSVNLTHPPNPSKLTPRHLGHALLALIWGIATFFISSLTIGFIISFIPFIHDTPLWTAILSALIYILSLTLAIWLPMKLKPSWKTSFSDLGLINLPTWLDIILAIAGYIVVSLLAFLLNQLFISLFSWYDPSQAQDVGFNYIYSFADRIIAFIALVIVAPIAEEILFRGYIYGKVRKYLPLIPAILLVSVVFGTMHGQWNAGLTTFALSLVLCAQREITGTIYSGIILHMINNALAFFIIYIIGT